MAKKVSKPQEPYFQECIIQKERADVSKGLVENSNPESASVKSRESAETRDRIFCLLWSQI